MKKLLICVCVAVAIGLVVGVVGLVAYAASGGKSEIERKTATFEFVGGDKIVVDCQIEDATVVVGNSANVVIEYDCSARNNPTLTKENGVVSYKSDWKRSFFFWNWFDSDYEVKVILPSAFDGDLVAKTTTGDLTVSLSNLSLKNLDVQTTTGDLGVSFSSSSADKFVAKATTGDLNVDGVKSLGDFSTEVTTGAITVSNVEVGGSAFVKATTGRITVSNAKTGGAFVGKNTTGKSSYSIDCASADLQTTTGELRFSISSATDISAKATTGDIVGDIYGAEEDFSIDYSVSTGESNLKKRTGGWKSAYFKVTTGDIFVYFK